MDLNTRTTVTEAGERARRPGRGTKGKAVTMYANYFEVNCGLKQAHHYDLKVTPVAEEGRPNRNRNPGKHLCRALLKELARIHKWEVGWAFDGEKNIFAPKRIWGQPGQVFRLALPKEDGTAGQEWQVEITWANTINLQDLLDFFRTHRGTVPREGLQALEVALKHGVAMRASSTLTSRAIFLTYSDNSHASPLGGGLEAWFGYKQALRPCQLGLALNVDTAVTTFVEEKHLHALMADALGLRSKEDLAKVFQGGIQDSARRKVEKFVRGLRASSTHISGQKRRYRIFGVSKQSAREYTFELEGGRRTTVERFMQTTYGIRLRYPYLPVVKVHETKNNFLPPEVLYVQAGQQRRGKLGPNQTQNMLRVAKQRPDEKRADILRVVTQQADLPQDATARAWKLTISDKMVLVSGRLLPSPILQYRKPAALDVGTTGAWNLRDSVLHATPPLTAWGVACLGTQGDLDLSGPTGITAFIEVFVKMLLGMGLGDVPPPIHYAASPHQDAAAVITEAYNKAVRHFNQKPQILLVVLPSKDADVYRTVKKTSDACLGLPSQCVVMENAVLGRGVERLNDSDRKKKLSGRKQYIANVIMKVNAKIGGTNAVLRDANLATFLPSLRKGSTRPYIVFGCDVSHPTSFDESEPSVAALVASMDISMTRYASRVLVQGHRTELVGNMHVPIRELLVAFFQATRGMKPEAIIFFRDGVSEGEYEQVRKVEYKAIRDACASVEEGYTPPITFITVQKRHNTRLLPDSNTPTDRFGNVVPGVVVDEQIGHATDFDFFLNSHASLQGTSRPAHYNVLVDENGFSADGVQMFTYWLCYLFCRCTRSVSYAAPAYYAHLAAARGKLLTEHSDSSSEASGASSGVSAACRINASLDNTMFYV